MSQKRAGKMPDPTALILAYPDRAAKLEARLTAAEALLDLAPRPRRKQPPAGPPSVVAERIGRYEARCVLGRGATAVVYRVFDPKFGREVALKVFRANLSDDIEAAERFDRDARLLAQLRHSNIVPLHEAGTHDGHSYIDLELVPGPSLEERLRRGGTMDFRAAAELVRKVALALHHAHRAGIVHRDVKTSNILLDPTGEPQLTDFGLARGPDGGATLTTTGQVLGTMVYMSPEQARGEGHRADGRSDVFSLGVVFYRLLTGRLPFGDDPAALVGRILGAEPTPLSQMRPGVPRDLAVICRKALAKEPADRFTTAEAFAEELRRWLADEPLTIRPPTRWEMYRRWLRAQGRTMRWLMTLTITLAIVCTLLGWSAWVLYQQGSLAQERGAVLADARARIEAWAKIDQAWQRVRSPDIGQLDETRRLLREVAAAGNQIADPDEVERITVQMRSLFAASLGVPDLRVGDWGQAQFSNSADGQFLTWPTAIHPSGEWVVISTQAGPVRWNRGQPPPPISEPGKPRELPRVGFSPDGKYLTVVPATGGLTVWDGTAVHCLKELERPGGSPVLAVGFSATGDTLWAVFADGRVRSRSLASFQSAADKQTDAGAVWTAARFSTDAQWLAAGDAKGRVWVFGQDGQQVRELDNPEQRTAIEFLAWSPIDKPPSRRRRQRRKRRAVESGKQNALPPVHPVRPRRERHRVYPRRSLAPCGDERRWDAALGCSHGRAVVDG
jgi:tRNA A-37 threonylcarbamoyl transferase component Bud32